jgi:uncharacterized protein (TIGR02246 family)
MTTRMILTIAFLAVFAAFTAISTPRAAALPGVPSNESDLAAIKKNGAAFSAAWNKHDVKALAALWAKDGDLIDPWGVTSVGRENVEKFFAEQHNGAGKLAKSTYELKADSVRFITPDVALEDWQVVLTGLSDKDGKAMGPMMHHVVLVWKKEGGKWEIAAARPGMPEAMAGAPSSATPTK